MDVAATAGVIADGDVLDRSATAGPAETGVDQPLQGLLLLAQFHGIAVDAAQLRHEAGRGTEPFDDTALLLAARKLGLKARIIGQPADRKSTRLNSSHHSISYAVFCLK